MPDKKIRPTAPQPIQAVYQALGARLRMIREALGMDQAEMGKRIGLTRTSVVNIEQGRQRVMLDQVEKFATALGSTPKHLMRGIWF